MSITPLQRRWIAAAFVVLLGLWTWKLLEPSPVPESILGGLRSWDDLLPFLLAKSLHFGGYAFLAALAFAGMSARWRVPVVAILLAHAVASEVLQYLLPFNRTGRVTDVIIDWSGIMTGLIVCRLALDRNPRLEADSKVATG